MVAQTFTTFDLDLHRDNCYLLYLLVPFYSASVFVVSDTSELFPFFHPYSVLFPSPDLVPYHVIPSTFSHSTPYYMTHCTFPNPHHTVHLSSPYTTPYHAHFYRINPGQSPSGHCSELRHCCGWSSYPIRLSRQ